MGCYSRAGGRGGCDLALRGVFVVGQADICQLGMDQRKVNVLAREYAGKTGRKKPVILSHPMLAGLLEGQEKMSKSVAGSAIFMEDSPVRQLVCLVCGHRVSFGLPNHSSCRDLACGAQHNVQKEVKKKINKAFCPPATQQSDIAGNPVLSWVRNIVFPKFNEFVVLRDEKYGGNKYGTPRGGGCKAGHGSLIECSAAVCVVCLVFVCQNVRYHG